MKITKYLIGGLAALALVGCKDKMKELNSNPNTIGETDPRYMFMNALSDFDYNRSNSTNLASSEGRMMQYFVSYSGAAEGTYSRVGRYSAPGQISDWYNTLYGVGYKMTLLQNYINDNLSAEEAVVYQDLHSIAGIMKVFTAFRVFQNYGAAVYSQAFKAITEGITTPAYDVFNNEIYEALDDELAGYIAVLNAEMNEGTVALERYDPIYGYVVNEGMGAPEIQSNYETQRDMWKKFGNSYRLYMAWIMKNADAARFSKVLSETQASGWFETANEGAYAYQNGAGNNGTAYNSDGTSQISMNYSLSDNFVSYLKELNDPRLPLLARANSLYATNGTMQWIAHYFPDSLEQHWNYNKESETWEQVSWNGIFDFENDPLLAYQGQSPNPADNEITQGPERFWNYRTFSFRFYHPDYRPGDNEWNDNLGPWTVTNKGEVTEQYPATEEIEDPVVTYTINVASRPQGRYFCAGGGKAFGDVGTNGGNGNDGPVDQNANIFFRRPLYTYPEFCYMMAFLTVDGANTGKSAAEWYESGLTAALEELQADAIRYGVQVATNTATSYSGVVTNPKIVGVNDNGVYSITDKIATYVAEQGVQFAVKDQKEAIVGQMWIYAYNQPIKMWDWWRVTGYPKIKEVATPADRPTGLYWVQPLTSDASSSEDNTLLFPRRGALPQPQALNNNNYNAARDELMTQPNYGATYGTTTGRIYWDVQGL